ncbi:ABC transporter permease [Spiroplasma monobiae]|uniref:ABC transporter permease n=1 Tax=Spiroplasma monobiae MQ-1 TaxID=1336748 RepID=A0A2K9LVF0_SPISQ|nr:ABC transporter permease [Spiroplasma monobiae]AUM62901.1 ABC transporter permease [Spiroplasma monobiae MQ-1]
MKNIFKSYMKAFIKAWVETLGTIVFLMIFTMLIFGMLSTPLQLSLKSTGVKKQTNLWQQQWEGNGYLDDTFVEEYILNNKEIKFNYEGIEFVLPKVDGRWLTSGIEALLDEYAKAIVEESYPNETLPEEEKKQMILEEKISAIQSLIWIYSKNGDEVERTELQVGNEEKTFKVGDIFTPNAKKMISSESSFENRDLKSFVVACILNQLENQSSNKFEYETFIKMSFNMKKSSLSNTQHFTYSVSNAKALTKGVDKKNSDINNLVLQEGRLPSENNEIVISDSYAKNQNKTIGDKVLLGNNWGEEKVGEFTIVGIGLKYSTLTPNGFNSFGDSIKDYGQIFLNDSFFTDEDGEYTFNKLFMGSEFNFNGIGDFKLKFSSEFYISKNEFYDINELFSQTIKVDGSSNDVNIFVPGTNLFRDLKSHSTIDKLTSLYIITWIYVVIGSILFILGFMFVLFVLKKEINNTRKQLGVFKSLGYKTQELTWVFSVKTFLTMIVGIGIGYILSFPFQIDSATKQFNTFVSFDYQTIYSNPLFLFILILIVPILFAGLSYLIIFKFLNEGALSLLTVGPKKSKADYIVLALKIVFFPALIYSFINWMVLKILKSRNKGFNFRMQHAFVSAGKGKFALIMGLFIFSSFLFTLQLRAMPVIKNMIEGGYNIYTKEVNHTYNLSNINPLTQKNGKIVKDFRKSNYDVKFTNINDQEVEKYVRENNKDYEYTNNFSKYMNVIAKARDEAKNTSYWETNKAEISMMLYAAALIAPLDKSVDQNVDYTKIKWPSEIPDSSILKVKPIDMSGLFLNDFGKLACVSPLSLGNSKLGSYTGSCNDVESFKIYLNKLMQNEAEESFNSNYANNISLPTSKHFLTLLSTFMKMESGINSLISVNEILFNGNKEAFQTVLPYYVKNNSDVDIEKASIKLIDTSEKMGGNVRSVVNLDSVSESQMQSLTEENKEYVNAIISYRLSKVLDKEIGDTFKINIGKSIVLPIKVAAINANDTLMQDIYADYWTTMKFINGSDQDESEIPLFNTMISSKVASDGKIDLTDIASSMNSFKYSRDTYAIASEENSPWLADVLAPKVGGIPEGPKNTLLITSPSVITLPILKSVIDQFLGKMTNSMLMYILIDVVLLIILLIVIMNIIITDSINVITIMRSLGYTNGQINWMVMGKYVSGAAISYIFAFIASIGVWKFIQSFVWARFSVLIALPSLPWIPFVSAIILGAILYIGWMAAMLQIKKRPLTLLVS